MKWNALGVWLFPPPFSLHGFCGSHRFDHRPLIGLFTTICFSNCCSSLPSHSLHTTPGSPLPRFWNHRNELAGEPRDTTSSSSSHQEAMETWVDQHSRRPPRTCKGGELGVKPSRTREELVLVGFVLVSE